MIEHGYSTIVEVAGYECELQIKQIGQDETGSNSNILGSKIEKKRNCNTFVPYFDIELHLPPINKDALFKLIKSFGPHEFPDNRRESIEIDGYKMKIKHDFAKLGEAHNFRYWFLGGHQSRYYEREPWENDLDSFVLILRIEIASFEPEGDDDIERNYTVPTYFKDRHFRLKIVLAGLQEYFGFHVKI